MGLIFEWSTTKAENNAAKHGVTFEEAATAFDDPMSLAIADPLHSNEEDRFILMGVSDRGRVLVVVHTEHEGVIRIISARLATRRERRIYEEGTNGI